MTIFEGKHYNQNKIRIFVILGGKYEHKQTTRKEAARNEECHVVVNHKQDR